MVVVGRDAAIANCEQGGVGRHVEVHRREALHSKQATVRHDWESPLSLLELASFSGNIDLRHAMNWR